jgi:hypothetical protein
MRIYVFHSYTIHIYYATLQKRRVWGAMVRAQKEEHERVRKEKKIMAIACTLKFHRSAVNICLRICIYECVCVCL